MIEFVRLTPSMTLDDYAAIAYLSGSVHELRVEAEAVLPEYKGRSVIMLSSTAKGGGVAEMIPTMVLMLNELGITTQWAVMSGDFGQFFQITKRIHNMIHGEEEPPLSPDERALYEEVNRGLAHELRPHLKPGDFLVVHDPQPIAAGAILKRELAIEAIWRCHIGLDKDLPSTRRAWNFLRPFAEAYDHSVFSAPEYIPEYLVGRASVIYPGIDPMSHKNRYLTPTKLAGILCNAGLAVEHAPVLTPPFPEQVQRLQPDGRFGPASLPDEIGFLYRPIVAEISRWDRLKGFGPLLQGFVRLKQKLRGGAYSWSPRDRHRLEIARLVLAGPDPKSVQDDPEAREVLDDLSRSYCALDAGFQKDIAIVSLPMESRKNNELMVNAIQRCATIVVQNSLQEGFGLTATEAMWKATPVLGTEACGLRQQIRDGIDGRLLSNPEDPEEIATYLAEMLEDDAERDRWSRNAQKRVFTEFMIFAQMQRWLRVPAQFLARPATHAMPATHAIPNRMAAVPA